MHKDIAFVVTTWIFLTVQNAPSVYKIIWDILDLCTYGTVDLEICEKYELWKIIYEVMKEKHLTQFVSDFLAKAPPCLLFPFDAKVRSKWIECWHGILGYMHSLV